MISMITLIIAQLPPRVGLGNFRGNASFLPADMRRNLQLINRNATLASAVF